MNERGEKIFNQEQTPSKLDLNFCVKLLASTSGFGIGDLIQRDMEPDEMKRAFVVLKLSYKCQKCALKVV